MVKRKKNKFFRTFPRAKYKYKKKKEYLQLILQRDNCGAGEAAGVVCDPTVNMVDLSVVTDLESSAELGTGKCSPLSLVEF